MADKTITQLTATTSAATADEIPIWVAGSAVTRKITKANLLSGYPVQSSGSWTPDFRFGGAAVGMTYSSRSGSYVKIGQLVIVSMTMTLSAKGSSTGAATIQGLPFAGVPLATCAIRPFTLASNVVSIIGILAAGTAVMNIVGMTAAGVSMGSLTDTIFGNTTSLELSLAYITS